MTAAQHSKAIVIGASAGAIESLTALLPELPQDYPLPIMVVVHLPPDKKSIMAEIFQSRCRMKVREAEDKEPICSGTVYFAPPDYHLQVEKGKYLSLSADEPVFFSRPSVDVLFETAADTYGADLTGIILSGANDDGARGLYAVIKAGGRGFIQNPNTSYASAMPEAARGYNPTASVMTLPELAVELKNLGAGA